MSTVQHRFKGRSRADAEERRVLRVAKLVSATLGQNFFAALVQHLATALGGDCVYVAGLDDAPVRRLRTLAVSRDGALAENFEQDLPGSSAGQVLSDGSFAWSKDVWSIFPADAVLGGLGAEGYVGVRLTDSAGQVIGLIALVSRERLEHVPVTRSVMETFVPRVAAELERRRADDALRESEQRYRAFISNSSDAMWRIEFTKPIPLRASADEQMERIYQDGYVAECNEAMARLAGVWTPEDLVGTKFSALFPPTDERIREELRSAIQSRYSFATSVTTPVGADGQMRYRMRTLCGIVENNELHRIWGTTRDITEWKRAEFAVEASEQRFRDVLENIEAPAVMLDRNGILMFCNDALLRIADCKRDKLLGKNWLVPIEDPAARGLWSALLSGREPKSHFEAAVRFRGAAPRLVVWDAIVLRSGDGQPAGVAAIGRDITEQRALEGRIVLAEKFEGIGRLAAGIGHDFNNFLTLIIGHVAIALEQLEPGSAMHSTLLAVQSASRDCAFLSEQLLAIGRRQHLKPELLDLNGVIARNDDVLQRIVGPDIEFVKNLDPSAGRIWADPVQIRRILANLATNSRDAMPEGGKLTIATANVEVGPESVPAGVPPGSYVRLTVYDTGTGLTDEVRRRMFEPFFTTKPPGKGTGLGLTTVYGIVSQSGGFMSAQGEPGVGTGIDVLFPRCEAPTERES